MRILLVEDHPQAARLIAKALREQAYAVDLASDAQSASTHVLTHDYDAVILDVGLPDRDGFAVCRDIREQGVAVPILMLTARDDVGARVAGLDAGADDYLIKPFDFRELLARVRALLRRRPQPPAPDQFVVGDLRFDVQGRTVVVHQTALRLTTLEYALLEYLGRRSDAVVGRAEISEHVWDENYDPLSNVIDVYIQRVRSKMRAAGARAEIRTRRGEGYQLVGTGPDLA